MFYPPPQTPSLRLCQILPIASKIFAGIRGKALILFIILLHCNMCLYTTKFLSNPSPAWQTGDFTSAIRYNPTNPTPRIF
jgi:hypothetical protein